MTAMIEVENLGKHYRRGGQDRVYRTFREDLMGLMTRPFRRRRGKATDTFWALRDVSFQVNEGEVVGIIGKNGAGKSTLLKILSRITQPTEGRARLYGRVGSLLEVGTGFHPELTGNENIYLSGTILGMRRAEVRSRFDEIVAFAEIEDFLDTPVKHYSSGMYVRLAFAVAAHLDPEILLVDEVLAVGDMEFQKKCLGKMGEVAEGGRTVVFVSHNMDSITRLCSDAILLDRGGLMAIGPSKAVVEQYLQSCTRSNASWTAMGTGDNSKGAFSFLSAALNPNDGDRSDRMLHLTYVVRADLPAAVVAIQILTATGSPVTTLTDVDLNDKLFTKKAGVYESKIHLPTHLLASGRYRITFSCADMKGVRHDYQEGILEFEMSQHPDIRPAYRREGPLLVPTSWETTRIE